MNELADKTLKHKKRPIKNKTYSKPYPHKKITDV